MAVNEKALLNLALDVSTIYLIAGKRTPEWLRIVGMCVVVYNIGQGITNLVKNEQAASPPSPPQLNGVGCGCAKCRGDI